MIDNEPNKDMRLSFTERSDIHRMIHELTLEDIQEVAENLGTEFQYSELGNSGYYGFFILPNQTTRHDFTISDYSKWLSSHSENTGKRVNHRPTKDKILNEIGKVLTS